MGGGGGGRKKGKGGGVNLTLSVGEGRLKLIFLSERGGGGGCNLILSHILPVPPPCPPHPGNYCTVPYFPYKSTGDKSLTYQENPPWVIISLRRLKKVFSYMSTHNPLLP